MAEYKKVDAVQLDAGLTVIAETIRSKTGSAELLSFPDGMASEVDSVYEAGKKVEHDTFWDAYQQNGNRTVYTQAFFGPGWTDETFRPKYSIGVGSLNLNNLFAYSLITDLVDILDRQGVTLDCSSCLYVNMTFKDMANVTKIPAVNAPKSTMFNGTFAGNQKLHTIGTITLGNSGNATFTDTFYMCYALENVTFSGVIGKDINFQWSSRLTADSIASIVNALSDTASGRTATFSAAAVNNAFETGEGAADGAASAEWESLLATKSNWTISLV